MADSSRCVAADQGFQELIDPKWALRLKQSETDVKQYFLQGVKLSQGAFATVHWATALPSDAGKSPAVALKIQTVAGKNAVQPQPWGVEHHILQTLSGNPNVVTMLKYVLERKASWIFTIAFELSWSNLFC